MTCKELGGACDKAFQANTFEEMAELSKQHGMEMWKANDVEHISVMKEMMELSKNPDALVGFMEEKRKAFDALPEK